MVAVALSSCASSTRIRGYSGPKLPADRVALLKPQSGLNNPSIYFVRIDAITFAKPQYSVIEIPAGVHEVEFGYEAMGYQSFGQAITRSWSTKTARVTFEAEAGHEYEARILAQATASVSLGNSQMGQWMGYVVDRSSGRIVGPQPKPQP